MSGPELIAVAYDASDPELIRRLMAAGELPVLSALAASGTWTDVQADAPVGALPPWPDFVIGGDFRDHEVSNIWLWDAAQMTLTEHPDDTLDPFWRRSDRRWGIFDVPLAPPARNATRGGFEISNWWSPWLYPVRTAGAPTGVRLPQHPLGNYTADAPLGRTEQHAIARRLSAGAQARGRALEAVLEQTSPEIVLASFFETHWGSHYLWELLEDDPDSDAADAFLEVFRSTDRALGRLIERHPAAKVCVFSHYGMERRRGASTVLGPLLTHFGLTHERGRTTLARTSTAVPRALRPVLRRMVPPRTRYRAWRDRLAQTCDWSRTVAFSVPTEQHGLVRINLAGREAEGIVAPEEYRGTCEDIAARLRAARDDDGRPLVVDVHFAADRFGGAPPPRAPDLFVEWTEAAHVDELRIDGQRLATPLSHPWSTGQHRFSGFCVTSEGPAPDSPLTPGKLPGHLVATHAS